MVKRANRVAMGVVAATALLVVLCGTFPASILTPVAAAAKEEHPLPALETMLAQQFQVSVMTTSHGTFNATLHIKGSLSFPDRMHGELVPHGQPSLQEGQTALPCFSRLRDFTDEKYAPSSWGGGAAGGDADAKKDDSSKSGAAAVTDERPTLLAFDIKLHHSNSPRGSVEAFLLPTETEELIETREALQEGTIAPTVKAAFLFRPERTPFRESPLSDVAGLANAASAVLMRPKQTKVGQTTTDNEAAGEEEEEESGHFTLRLISDHEFSLELSYAVGKAGATERVWVHGYTQPSESVYHRGGRQRPWWYLPMMIAIGVMTSLVQVLTGISDGKKKAAERQALEAAKKEQDKSLKKVQ